MALQQAECERKNQQIEEREYGQTIQQKQSEIYSLVQKIKALSHERDLMNADSEDRVKLSLKKAELETQKKKHKKMQVTLSLIHSYFFTVLFCSSL